MDESKTRDRWRRQDAKRGPPIPLRLTQEEIDKIDRLKREDETLQAFLRRLLAER